LLTRQLKTWLSGRTMRCSSSRITNRYFSDTVELSCCLILWVTFRVCDMLIYKKIKNYYAFHPLSLSLCLSRSLSPLFGIFQCCMRKFHRELFKIFFYDEFTL
jgi:hypothetical protein